MSEHTVIDHDGNVHFKLRFTESKAGVFQYVVVMPGDGGDYDVYGPAPMPDCCAFMLSLDDGGNQ